MTTSLDNMDAREMTQEEVDAFFLHKEIEGWRIDEPLEKHPLRISRLYYCTPLTEEFEERAGSSKCVCKFINPREGEEWMEREFQANRDLMECPHIARTIYAAEEKILGGYLIFMRAYRDDALEYARIKGPLCFEEAVEIIRSVCIALQYMHELDYVHRDVKLENIFLGDGEIPEAFLGDLGTAEQLESEPFTDTVGTVPYQAPELLENKPYGKPVDVWALGVSLYHLLTRNFPFGDPGYIRKYKAMAKAGNYSLDNVPELAQVILRGTLEVDPSKRMTVDRVLELLPIPKP